MVPFNKFSCRHDGSFFYYASGIEEDACNFIIGNLISFPQIEFRRLRLSLESVKYMF